MLELASSMLTTPDWREDLRQLRFPNAIDDAESIPGFLARCAADHPVPRLATIYAEIGFEGRLPGKLQFADPVTLERLAYVTRSDPSALMRNAGQEARKKVVAFGDLEVLAENLACGIRRIAPRTLKSNGIHRRDWLMKTLPFCPVSGELLVSRCLHCGKNLGWTYTAGIANCEHCEETVSPSTDEGLHADLLQQYRSFSRLISLDQKVRDKERLHLPDELRSHSPSAVVNLAIRVHRHLRDLRGTNLRASLHSLDPYEIADIISGAMTLLTGWPGSVQDAVRHKVGTLDDDHESFVSLWRRLKAISNPHREAGLEQADILLAALPDVARPVWRSFAPPYRVYLQQEARLKTGLKGSQLTAASAHLTTTQLPSAGKRNIFYKADEIDALRQLTAQTVPLSTVARDWRLPNYAVEQLAANNQLAHADEPVLQAIYSQQRIRRASLEKLTAFLIEHRLKSKPRKNASPLADVLRMYGGREKPWAAIFDAMIAKRIRWWCRGGKLDAKSLLVEPTAVWGLNNLATAAPRKVPLDNQGISKKDAAEVLNVTPAQFKLVQADHLLCFERLGKADVLSKKEILEIAGNWITAAEIQARLNGEGRNVDWQREVSPLEKRAAGWPRDQVHHLFDW